MTSVGGFVHPLSARDDSALRLEFDPGASRTVHAALAPGRFERVGLSQVATIPLGEPMRLTGPGVLALDGERERVLRDGQHATLTAHRDGPWVIDVSRVLRLASGCGRQQR